MNEILVLLGAEIDLQECYAKQSPTRAERLDAEIRAGLHQLATFPYSSRTFEGVFRRYVLKGFPYALFYTVEGNRVMIQAVFDTRLSSAAIRRRLGL